MEEVKPEIPEKNPWNQIDIANSQTMCKLHIINTSVHYNILIRGGLNSLERRLGNMQPVKNGLCKN